MGKNDLHSGHRERMFKKYSENGIDCFEDHEKLEILLFYVLTRVNTNEIAHSLINRFGSLNGVLNAPKSELKEIDGISQTAALKIHYLRDFFHYVKQEKPQLTLLDSVDKVAEYCRGIFSFKTEEEMVALFLDTKSTLIGRYDVKGYGPNAIQFDIKEFSRKALESKCSGVVLAHSHIYSPLLPSDSDIITTRKISNMLKTLGIELIDHIIVNDWGEFSMRSTGDMKDVWP